MPVGHKPLMSRNPYFEHDDRVPGHRAMGRNRKQNFSRGGPRGGNGGFPRNRSRFQDQDGDVDMSAPGGSWNTDRRLHPYRHPKNNKRRKDKNNRGQGKGYLQMARDADNLWYRITVPYGKKIGKQFILKTIASNCRVPFVPYNFHFDGNSAVFFVMDHTTALHVKDVDRRISTPEGFKMGVFMQPSAVPNVVMDQEITENLKECMSSLYDAATHSLSLRKFHHNPALKNQGLYMPLHRQNVLNAVVKIIKENIPEIEGLDLSDNRLTSLSVFKLLVPVCKQLKTLSLQNNRIKFVHELNSLKGLDIRTLILDGNPLCDDFKDKTSYISAIRDRFPKLINLDGHELPAPIGFDLGSENIPPSKGSFFIAEDVKGLVIQFLEQYYTIYDSDNRGKLLEAYHEHASFSLCIPKLPQPSKQKEGLQSYVRDSRNLARISDTGARYNLLKQGRLAVVSALTQLPPTQHDPHSFMVDIFHVSPGLMSFAVTGVFKEVGADMTNMPLRTFHRTFLVAAQGQGFVITNEMLFISSATPEQVKSFKFPAPTPSPSPAPPAGDRSPSEKQQLAIEFMKFTGMNLDFAAKCLEENDWDSQKAAAVFTELNNLGRIPPEAFIMK